MSATDKDREPGTFMIQACRCRRCGGLLTSKEGVRNGIGHVCRMKALREMPDPNQVTVFDVLNDKEGNTHEKYFSVPPAMEKAGGAQSDPGNFAVLAPGR